MTEATASEPLSHAERAKLLNFLFDSARPPGGPKITNKAVADHVARLTGQPCSRAWIGDLRSEDPGRPMRVLTEQLNAIADFFHANPVIWVDRMQAEQLMAQMDALKRARDSGAVDALEEAQKNSGLRVAALRAFTTTFQESAQHMTVDQLNAWTALMKTFGADSTDRPDQL